MSNQTNSAPSEVAPIVAGIVDGNGNFIEPGGMIYESNSVVLIGTGSPNTTVKVYDNTAKLGEVAVNTYGRWHLQLSNLPTGKSYSIKAIATLGDNIASKEYAFDIFGGPPTK
jgi:hypothetical protein